MRHGSLFSGIGGFDLAAESMGWTNVFHCEWMPFPRKILSHYWPEATSYHDIITTDFSVHRGQIDILTGGFPCQPYSAAGKRKGKDDDRHLWPHMLRCIREVRPRWVVGENVFGLVTWNAGMVFEEVCADLESEGYSVQPFVLPAAAVNAPHRRDRVWFVANARHDHNADSEKIAGLEGPTTKPRGVYRGVRSTTDADGVIDRGTAVESRTAYQQRRSCETDTSIGDERQFEPIRHVASEGHATDSSGERARHFDLQQGIAVRTQFDDVSNGGHATDSSIGGIQGHRRRCENWEFQTNEFNTNNRKRQPRMDWEKFPTVPPICGGDDGLPYELDGITFSKWRNESIKGYGNAIVPQVAIQIFRAIEAYERL